MRRLFLFPLILLLHPLTLTAEETVRSVQEELRRRNIYFGDIDGRRSPEYEQAVKRYQQRKGFGASGHDDAETLRSLGLQARAPGEPPPKELEWPEEPVLRSDVKIDVEEEAAQVARESGVAPQAIAVGARSSAGGSKQKTGAARTAGGASAESRFNGGGVKSSRAVDSGQIKAFIADYLRAMGRNDLQNELRFYADGVDYFHNGHVDRRIVERTLRNYYRRWNSRSYSLAGAPSFSFVRSRGEIVVTFPVQFSLSGHGKRVRGKTENRVVINAATADPRIAAIDERRVRY